MASTSENFELTSICDNFDDLPFEARFKVASKWKKEEWESKGLSDSRLHRLINSALHWKGRLKEAFTDTNIILTLHNDNINVKIEIEEIVNAIEAFDQGIKVVDYNHFINPRYICIDFETTNMKLHVLEKFRKVGLNDVAYLLWIPDSTEFLVRAHWLPKGVGVDKLARELDKYFTFKFLKRETSVHMNGKVYGCGVLVYLAKFKKGVTMEQVPHLIKVGSLDCLWTIPNREPCCLKCNKIGHKSFQCDLLYCKVCKAKKPRGHICHGDANLKGSYAEAVGKLDKEYTSDDEDLFASEDEVVSKEEFEKVEKSIAEYKNSMANFGKKDLSSGISEKAELINSRGSASNQEEKLVRQLSAGFSSLAPEGIGSEIIFKPDVLFVNSQDQKTSKDREFRVVANTRKNSRNRGNSINKEKLAALATGVNTYSKVVTRSEFRAENLFDGLKDEACDRSQSRSSGENIIFSDG